MAEPTKYKAPSAKTVNFLYNGIIAFYPDTAKKAFGLGKITLPFHESWGGFKRLDFLEFCLNITGPETTTIEEAASIVSRWKKGEDLERTIPEKLDEMVAHLEEEEEKRKSSPTKPAPTYEKQKLVKDTLLESQRAKEVSPPPPTETPMGSSPAQQPKVSIAETKTAPTDQAAGSGISSIGIKITPETGKVFQKFTNRVASFPVRAAIAFATPSIALESGGATSSALTLWAHGIKSQALEQKVQGLGTKETKRVNELIKSIKGIETNYSLQTRIIQRSFPIRDITLLLGPDAGLTQAQISIFFNPPEQGGTIAVPRRSFFGNLFADAGRQLFGKISKKAIKGIATKAASALAGEAAGAAAGTEAGAAVGAAAGGPAAPLTAIVGAILGWIASKIPNLISWLKRNAKEFGIAAAALLGAGVFLSNPILLLSGLGLGAISLGAGGFASLGSGVAGLGHAVLSGITTILLPSIGIPVLVGLISVPVVIAVILFIINSGAYVVPPAPFSESPFGISITCSDEKGPIPFSNSTSSPIARRGWQITADLYQGFWCFWNRSPGDFPEDTTLYPPSYPQLFNEGLYARNPNPSREEISSCGECLFWCTYLVQKAYRETGNTSLLVTLWSPTMQQDFTRRGKFLSSSEATPAKVVPGSVVFFRVTSGPARTNHVGIVHTVNQDGIVYIQSNAPTKNGLLVFNSSGRGIQNLPGINVVGIGLP
jgi:hypothetical protein